MPYMQQNRRSPEEVKREKLNKLRNDITKLRQRKAVLRLELSQQRQNMRAEEYRARLDALDQKVADKLQQMRDVTTNAVRRLGGPVEIGKRVWDNWRI